MAFTALAAATNLGSTFSPGPPANGVWWTIDANWRVGMDALTAPTQNATAAAVANRYNPTDLVASSVAVSTCTFPTHDVCAVDDNFGANGLFGWNSCPGQVGGSAPFLTCTIQLVRYNLTYTPHSWNWLACHELGHTVGLRHISPYTTSLVTCMGPGGSTGLLGAHEQGHINGHY